jgi:hypothetical protein
MLWEFALLFFYPHSPFLVEKSLVIARVLLQQESKSNLRKRPPKNGWKILRTVCHRPYTNSALRGLQRSPVAHMKALNALSSSQPNLKDIFGGTSSL